MSDFHEMQERAWKIAEMYDDLNQAAGRPSWTAGDYMAGFVGDVGDLSKLVMAHEGLREIPGYEAKLEHEIGDGFWSLYVLCKKLGIDPKKAFSQTMDELEGRFAGDEQK